MNLESIPEGEHESIYGALAGIRVVEYCSCVAGPWCGRLLATLGAEVIKVEDPGRGDESRLRGPFLRDTPHPETSGLFLYLNMNKLGVTLNFETKAGQRLFKRLIADSDILIEDQRPGNLDKYDLGYSMLSAINQRLIMASITPFGQTGPYKDYKAYPLNVFHSGGEGYMTPGGTKFAERPPLQIGGLFGEYEVGLTAVIPILGALCARDLSGLGQYIDISKQEAQLAYNGIDLPRYANEGVIITRKTRGYSFAGIMPCKDGYVEIAMHRDEEWQALVELFGNPSWAKDERFATPSSRAKHGEEINRHIIDWLATRSKEEIYQRGQRLGCSVGAFRTAEDVMNSEQFKERQFLVNVEHPVAGNLKYLATPFKVSGKPRRVDNPAPTQGQHNEAVYCGKLSLTKEELSELRSTGVV